MGQRDTIGFPLGELVSVRQGMTQRGGKCRVERVEQGPHYLRIGDLSGQGEIRVQRPFPISIRHVSVRRFLVSDGDLVMANRGERFTAALIPDGMAAVASGQLLIVKILTRNLEKEYLNWYFNLDETQARLRALSRGNRVKTLSVSVLRSKLIVPVPSVSIQKRIAELVRLVRREEALAERLRILRRRWVEDVLLGAVLTG